ncbi:MAG: hypothetical protein ACI8T1_002472 [Verrucomicrobiales bacterium]|jgi:hypothetical protein
MKHSWGMKTSILAFLVLSLAPLGAQSVPLIEGVEAQPLNLQVQRLVEALDYLGQPLKEDEKKQLVQARGMANDAEAVKLVQTVLDPYCLARIQINPESRVKVADGPAKRDLVEQGWRAFLVKVHNEAGVTHPLEVRSQQAKSLHGSPSEEVRDRWMDLDVFNDKPMTPALSGLLLEYRIVQLYSRDGGKRSAVLEFSVGQGTQDLGFRSDLMATFVCAPSQAVPFEILDEHGKPTTASLEIRDALGRVYPSQTKRLAPDFSFHPQVYRHSGETVKLPVGTYKIKCARGPEYHAQTKDVVVAEANTPVTFSLKRWIDPAALGWWSGDHHIHAAGCSHYNNPTEGVHAPDMMRHCLGEDLKVGANLTWGPCFDYQKQFFTGKDDSVSQYPYLLRYDIEVSGFGSHQSGHLCLLRLEQQMYPGGNSKDHWPTLCLNTLRWAQQQGAVCGPAHSGWGLSLPSNDLPNYEIPPFDGIGACEYIVDVTHEVPGPDGKLVPAVDFISTVDTPYPWELNIWYHTLNAGFRTRISGETDFPCIYGERVGLGRSYVKMPGKLDYDGWCQGIEEGRNYVSDGYSHLLDFEVNGVELASGKPDLRMDAPGKVTAKVKVAALLGKEPNNAIRNRGTDKQPYWHLERARRGDTQEVSVELLVDGVPREAKIITADGDMQELTLETKMTKSGWVAMRILPSSHTNPIFVHIAEKPVRSKKSLEWCLKSVDQLWSQKERFIAPKEMQEALDAYEHARKTYRQRIAEASAE